MNRRSFLGALLAAPLAAVGLKKVLVPVAAIHDSVVFKESWVAWDIETPTTYPLLRSNIYAKPPRVLTEKLMRDALYYRGSQW